MIRALLSGEVQAIYGEDMHIYRALHNDQHLALHFRIVAVPNIKDNIAIAVSPQSPNLLAFINLLLELDETKAGLSSFLKIPLEGTR